MTHFFEKSNFNIQIVGFFVIIGFLALSLFSSSAQSQNSQPVSSYRAPTNSELIYEDALQPGWETDNIGFINVNESATTQVFAGGRSIEVVFQNEFSRFLFETNSPFSVGDYDSISFHIYVSDAGQTVSFDLLNSSFTSLGQVAVPVVVDSWSAVTIDFSSFADSNDVTFIQFSNVATTSPIYFDNVVLGDTAILTPTPAGTHTPTPSSSATPLPPTATPTPTVPAGPQYPSYVYTDSVEADWRLSSSASVSLDPSSTAQIYTGSNALEMSFPSVSPIAFFVSDTNLDTADYESISFWLYGNEEGQSFDLELAESDTTSLKTQNIEITAGMWGFVTIDMSEFDPSAELGYIIIRNVSSSSPIYIDNLSLNLREAPELTDSIYLPIGIRE